MKNIKIVQAAWISRRVQEISKKTGKDWLELISQEIENIKNN